MRTQRQPSEQFLSRVRAYRKPERDAKPPSRIRRFRDSDWWLWAEVVAVIFIIPTGFALWVDLEDRKSQREALRIDLEDRKKQRIAQAWALVTQPAPGNSGKGAALEFLNSQDIPLVGIDLSKKRNAGSTHLVRVNLSGAFLGLTNLSGANLGSSYLYDAHFIDADLSGARLWDADLRSTYLGGTNLSGADLLGADLSGSTLSEANLSGADLSNANLSEVYMLKQAQLDTACGDKRTRLPEGLTIKSCPERIEELPPPDQQDIDLD